MVSVPLWIISFAQIPALICVFPDGSLLSARWRLVARGLVGALALAMVSSLLIPEVEVRPPVSNFITVPDVEAVASVSFITIGLFLMAQSTPFLPECCRRASADKVDRLYIWTI